MDKNRQHYKMTLLEWCKINNVGLIDEWDKTNEVSMAEIGSSSGIKVKWICSRCGFHFEQRPSDRTRGHGCPKCARKSHSSVPETICYLAVKKYYPDAIHGYKAEWLGRREIDIFIPSLNIGIEYDGNSWHNESRRQMDDDKERLCAQHNITIYRIREIGCDERSNESRSIYYKPNRQYIDLENAVSDLLKIIGVNNPKWDDWQALINNAKLEFVNNDKSNSLGVLRSDLNQYWDYDKNYPLTPYDILAHSNYKVWFKCDKGHSYQRKPNATYQKNCPICINKIVLVEYNDLATIRPDLALDWNYEKNGNLTPYDIVFGSNKQIWWKCHVCGNEFLSSPNARKDSNGHCAKCAPKGKKQTQTINC